MNKYKGKDRKYFESTSKLQGVELKIRPCIHEMDMTILYKLCFFFFCKCFDIENFDIFCKWSN